MKLHYITFINDGYMSPNRILSEAAAFNIFDSIKCYNETDISGFIDIHKEFIKANTYGYGNFIWKPKIIEDALNKIEENDILLFTDAGTHLNVKGIDRFREYIDILKDSKYDILAFSASSQYKTQQYVKMDVIMYYYPEVRDKLHNAFYSGAMIMKKSSRTMEFIKDYLHLCTNYNFLTQSWSRYFNEIPIFRGQDYDNGLYNLCIVKHTDLYNNIYYISGDEAMLYDSTGHQDYNATDWSSLNKFPIQFRRLTPKWSWKNLDYVD